MGEPVTDLEALVRGVMDGVRDFRVPSAPGTFTPIGVVLHHTASRLSMDPMPSLRTVQYGRSDLPGPLCNVLVGRDGQVAVITDGRANDTGGGDPCVLAALRNDRPIPAPDDRSGHRVNGNPWFYDVEVENDGVGEGWSDRLIARTVEVAAVLCRYNGWGAERVICHREWTRRKIDPSWRGDWRGLVAAQLGGSNNQEDDVIGTDQLDDRKAAARQLFRIYLDRNPNSQDELDKVVWYIATRGYEAAVVRFADHSGVLDL